MKKCIINHLLVLFALVVLLGCANTESDEFSRRSEKNNYHELTVEENKAPYEADYEILWDALRNTYPYLFYLQTQGVDVDGIHLRYAEEIRTIIDEDDFYNGLQRMLSELNNFAHLRVITPEEYESYYHEFVRYSNVSDQSNPYYEVLTNSALSERYKTSDTVDESKEKIQAESNPELFIQYYPDCRTLYIKKSYFSAETINRDRDILYDSIEKYPETEHIIFDVSGNRGGNCYYWLNNFVAPFGESYEFYSRTFYKTSPLFEQFHSMWKTKPVSELDDAPEWVSEFGLDQYFVFSYKTSDTDEKIIDKEIKRWVLTSKQSYSAAETFACFAKTTGWATVVGTQTAGDGMHTTPVLLLLPDSEILVSFSDGVGENPDGSINAIHGTVPNILCKKGETPLGRCLEAIRNYNK